MSASQLASATSVAGTPLVEERSAEASTRDVRFHSLDAARAVAMLLGVLLHAVWLTMPRWVGTPMADASGNLGSYYLLYAIHVFRMQAFFLVAGFFANLLVRKRGTAGFVKHRFFRIALPLVAAWFLLAPLCIYYGNLGGVMTGRILSESGAWQLTWQQILGTRPNNILLLHLWFLYYLLLLYSGFLLLRWVGTHVVDRHGWLKRKLDGAIGLALEHPFGFLILATISFLPLLTISNWWGVGGSLSGLIPKDTSIISYAIFFTVGWFLFDQQQLLDRLSHYHRPKLVVGALLSVILFGCAWWSDTQHWPTSSWDRSLVAGTDLVSYERLREQLLTASGHPGREAAWAALPDAWKTFVTEHEAADANQKAGLVLAVNLHVLTDEKLQQLSRPEGNGVSTAHAVATRELLAASFPGAIAGQADAPRWLPAMSVAVKAVYAVAMWCLVLGFLGFFETYFRDSSPRWRYISDSSYWIYLVHIPIQFQLQIWWGEATWPAWMKVAMYTIVTCLIAYPMYHLLVRPTFFGLFLNGRRYPLFAPRAKPRLEPSAEMGS